MTASAAKNEISGPRPRTLAVAGLVAFLVFFIMKAPASLLWGWLGSSVPQLQLVGVRGTLWSGQAEAGYYEGLPLGALAWRWQPLALPVGHWRNWLTVDSASLKAEGGAGWSLTGKLVARDLSATMSLADALSRYVPANVRPPVAVEGDLDASIDALTLGDESLERLDGEVRVRALNIGGVIYGDAEAVLSSRDGTVTAEFHTLPGAPVQLEGTASVLPGGEYRLQVSIQDPESMGQDVGNLVKALASRADDRWRLDWKGKL